MMDEEDGEAASNEERGRAACSVLATLGRHEGITTCRLDGWEYLPQAGVYSLLAALPGLSRLELLAAYRLDLDALLMPGITQLTALQAHADHILMAPDVLRSAPALHQLRELRLTGLQVNDQPADNELCGAIGALTALTHLELVTFSAATRPGMVALRGIHNETLRGHPLARLGPSLAALTGLQVLVLSDPHLEVRTANALLAALTGLGGLRELIMPEARTREEGWRALQALTCVTKLHLYSIELKGQARAAAPGSITWWRRLRLEDTCLPELASFMPVPGLRAFIATLYMRYGEGPVPQREFRGLDAVMGCLGAAEEVRLWLELDCDVWPGLSRLLSRLPGLQEVVVRARHPHPLAPPDLSALLAAATRLAYLDLNNAALPDAALRPLEGLPRLSKVCLGLAAREGQVGHTPAAVQWLAGLLAARRRPALVVAPHLLDGEMEELEAWQAADPGPRGGLPVAAAAPELVLPLPEAAAAASPGLLFSRAAHGHGHGHGGGHEEGGGHEGGRLRGGGGGAARRGGGGGGGGGGGDNPSGSYSGVDPDDPLVLLSNSVNDFFARVDL